MSITIRSAQTIRNGVTYEVWTMKIRPANTGGHLQAGWIESRRTFSNNSYWNPNYMNWGNLRVINDDVQQPGNLVPKWNNIYVYLDSIKDN